MSSLKDKVAVITGGSRGIGRAICLRLAKSGASVVINFTKDSEKAQNVADEIKESGGAGLIFQADVSDIQQAGNLIEFAIQKFGKIDILVNNAGITSDNLLIRMKEEEWDKVISTNLKGVFNCTQPAIKYMIKQRNGVVINISSVIGVTGNAGQSNYAASKAGVIGFTKSVAREVASRGIRLNVVAPGFIETDMTESLSTEFKDSIIEKIPLKKFGEADSVAALVEFLASEEADYITGQVINIDGGMVMG